MDTHIDFLQLLPSDLSLNILGRLDDSYDILHASAVSRSWHRFVLENGLCKQLCVRMCPELSRVDRVIEPRPAADAARSSSMEWEPFERDHRVYASFSRALTALKDRLLQTRSYRSSTGQNVPRVAETLLYKLSSDLCVITEIDIRPLEAYFQAGNPVYSAKCVRFLFGHPKSTREFEGDDEFIWTYTSQEFPMSQENKLQKFKLPSPVLCGGFLQIELSGRDQRQEICVQVIGRSLFPAFAVEIDRSGNFLLKYCPVAFKQCLHSTSNGETSLPVEERMWGTIGRFRRHF